MSRINALAFSVLDRYAQTVVRTATNVAPVGRGIVTVGSKDNNEPQSITITAPQQDPSFLSSYSIELPPDDPVVGDFLIVDTISNGISHMSWGYNPFNPSGNGENIFSVDAGNTTLTGTYNLGLFTDSLISITTGDNNTCIGYQTGQDLTTGDDNVCIGYRAGTNIVDGNSNTCIGLNAGLAITSANYSICIGYESGKAITTGVGNVCVGYQSGIQIIGGQDNVCVGFQAGRRITSGQYNIAIGDISCGGSAVATTGLSNIGIGLAAGTALTSGSENICIGGSAGLALTNTTGSVCIGANAMTATTGVGNTAVGYSALTTNTTGTGNTTLGYYAGLAVTGSGNTCIGGNTMFTGSISGDFNIAIGLNALDTSVAITNNIAIGAFAGTNLDNGSNNIFIGRTASSRTTSNRNVLIGYFADGGSFDDGIIIGTEVGGAAIANTASGQVCIGVSPGTATADALFLRHRTTAAGTTLATWVGNELIDNSSSQRFKEDIKDYQPADNFDLIQPRTYLAKDGYGAIPNDPTRYVGMIAEEINEIYPEFVVYEQDGVTPKGLQYDKFVALLIYELQKERQQRKALENSVNELRTMIEQL